MTIISSMSIAQDVSECADAFRSLQTDLVDGLEKEEIENPSHGRFKEALSNSFERFQLWASNSGAHRRDRNSLDQRLWEASNLREQVRGYLEDLKIGLSDAFEIVTGIRRPWDELSESSTEETDDENDNDMTELEQLYSYIDNIVGCLLRISMVIQKPAPHDRFIKSGRFDQSYRQPWDEQYVRDKFVGVPEWLSGRLGKAISRRRQFLEYRKSHHQRIADTSNIPETTETVVSSLPTVAKQDGHAQVEPFNDLDDGVSMTSYAETVFGEDALCTPRIPDAAKDGAIFECPYCFLIIGDIKNKLQWKRHVFSDLQPYICIYPDCVSADETFSRRREWIEHETRSHLTTWKCNLGCSQLFTSESSIQKHFADVHDIRNHDDTRIFAFSTRLERQIPQSQSCPLCQEEVKSLSRYHRHVARHLEQLALFAIPREELEEDKEEEDIKEHSSQSQQGPISNTSSNEDSILPHPPPPPIPPQIRFKDAIGRKFLFPWELCKTWKGMEELIKQAFSRVEDFKPHVHECHYDLLGPDGEIILPQQWEAQVQPGWSVTMRMWPHLNLKNPFMSPRIPLTQNPKVPPDPWNAKKID